jgi:hypothetical protein
MSVNDPVEYKQFVIAITSSEEPAAVWQGRYHISVNGKLYKEKSLRPLRRTRDAAETDALSAAKAIVDEITDGKSTLVEYRGYVIKQVLGRVKDDVHTPRWHATVVVDSGDRSTSTGFVSAEPGYSLPEAALNGMLAGQRTIDERLNG